MRRFNAPPTGILAQFQNAYFEGPDRPIELTSGNCLNYMYRQQIGHFMYMLDRVLGPILGPIAIFVVMGGLALSARGSLNKALATYPGDATAIADAQKRTKTFALVTDVATGVTVASAVTTVVLYLVAPRSVEKAPPSTTVGVSTSGLVVSGSF